ncbi:uncharacterized protein PITG_20481 [Phytophthora infestans T30-4]|uniref:Uncharacterized protein n=1 Tax=Phytophthora infestans (strain T30-4) TaxID=403677 RepID=D0P291_PHYIT|nr:uncharacterized protein PITG_20481 [Phytophthora infestans T30-4]EEY55842.1 conserved hypothetical protein [Phytophthora infestans T30-4]|eukprot:XP_002895575.1 conserved hypothetical protein [Phytophthora infestans T30-4]
MASSAQQYEADGDAVMHSAHQPVFDKHVTSTKRPSDSVAVDDVSNEEILILINQRIGTVKNEQIPDLDELFKRKLKINLAEDDIDARVLKYYRDFATIIENNGLEKILGVGNPEAQGFADRMKMRCSILIDNLEPRMVRDDVRRHCKYACREAKKTISCSSISLRRRQGHSTSIICWRWSRR